MFLETWQNLPQNTCARVSLLIKLQACNFIERETLAQVFCCEFCEIFKNTFLTEHLRSVFLKLAKHRSLNAVLILQRCIQNSEHAFLYGANTFIKVLSNLKKLLVVIVFRDLKGRALQSF